MTYRLATAGDVTLRVYNLTGQVVATLVEGPAQAGVHHVRWDGRDAGGRDVASGVYFVRLDGPDVSLVRRITLLR